jgi:hypothetical protein
MTRRTAPAAGSATSVDAAADGLVVALDAADGTTRWRRERRDSASTVPLVAGDHVVLSSADQRIVCD